MMFTMGYRGKSKDKQTACMALKELRSSMGGEYQMETNLHNPEEADLRGRAKRKR